MPRRTRGTLVRPWLPIAMIVVFFAPVATAWAQTQRDVLVLYATRPDARIAVLGDRELPRMLERGLGQRVSYYSEHLDLARFADERYQSAVTEFLRQKYMGQRFDVVIAMHEIALQFLGSTRKKLFLDTPVVFFSHTPKVERFPNSTGVVTDNDFGPTIALASTLQPDIKRVYVVTGADSRDRLFETQARSQLKIFEPRLAITYLNGLSTPELKARLSALTSDSIIYYLLVNRDGAGESFHPLEYLTDIAPVANVPIYSWVDSTMGHGIVGGSLKSQERQTAAVAELALHVLRGDNPDNLPIKLQSLQVNQVDWRQLQRWRISESRLPPDTVVLFKEPTVWQRYKLYVLVALTLVLAQTALIAGLLLQRQRRRQAEEQVRGSRAALQTSYDRIRTLGVRLLNAQDTERARIARELHDDVSQQLALLSIDIDLLRGANPSDSTGLAVQAWDRTQTIARSVHDLAYRLYPAKLRLIGLLPALEALKSEMERAGIVMKLSHENVPASLPPDVTLCIFRVVQEALQNVIKYSGAREVSLALRGTPDGLALTIADDGIGFDVGAAWGKGLGLASMSERLEAMKGTFQIRATPGGGTRIEITVPLADLESVAVAG